jgi:hypothetical protein
VDAAGVRGGSAFDGEEGLGDGDGDLAGVEVGEGSVAADDLECGGGGEGWGGVETGAKSCTDAAMDESPWPLKRARKQRSFLVVIGRKRENAATSPPLGGASECFHGRSSDSAGSTLLTLTSQSYGSSRHLGRSYLLTAAGQFRILTGFPFTRPRTVFRWSWESGVWPVNCDAA